MDEAQDRDFLHDLEDKVARAVADAIRAGDQQDVRERVAREVAAAVAVAAQTCEQLDDVLRAATRGAVRAVREADRDAGLSAAVEGLGEGIERAALGARLAFEEAAAAASPEAVREDWAGFAQELRELCVRFVDIVGRAAGHTGDRVASGVGDLTEHARRARADFEPRVRRSLEALGTTGARIGRRAAAMVFATLGDAMHRASSNLRK